MRLIDADALHTKILEENRRNYAATENVAQILLRIETEPTIDDEPVRHGRWIPVEDSLPDSKDDVLVWFEYFRYGEYDCLYQTYGIGNYNKNYDDWMVNHETGWAQLRVIAWMPLPEPPKE